MLEQYDPLHYENVVKGIANYLLRCNRGISQRVELSPEEFAEFKRLGGETA